MTSSDSTLTEPFLPPSPPPNDIHVDAEEGAAVSHVDESLEEEGDHNITESQQNDSDISVDDVDETQSSSFLHRFSTITSSGEEMLRIVQERPRISKSLFGILGSIACYFTAEDIIHHYHPAPLPPAVQRPNQVMICAALLSSQSATRHAFDQGSSPQVRAAEWFISGDGQTIDVPPTNECSYDTTFGQLYSLLVVRESMGITSDVIPSWSNSNKPISSIESICHSWHNIGCNDDKTQINKLRLSNMNLKGTIPNEISGLMNLQRLELNNNLGLSSTIPSTLGDLDHLQYLHLHHTSLGGDIPSSLGQLRQLDELFLEDTNVKGRMPSSICHLRNEGSLGDLHSDCGGGKPRVLCQAGCCTVCDVHKA